MKATVILAGAVLPFVAWATTPSGAVRRLEILARCQADAIRYAFTVVPNAVAMSARRDDRVTPLRDALLQLDRRAAQ